MFKRSTVALVTDSRDGVVGCAWTRLPRTAPSLSGRPRQCGWFRPAHGSPRIANRHHPPMPPAPIHPTYCPGLVEPVTSVSVCAGWGAEACEPGLVRLDRLVSECRGSRLHQRLPRMESCAHVRTHPAGLDRCSKDALSASTVMVRSLMANRRQIGVPKRHTPYDTSLPRCRTSVSPSPEDCRR